MKAKYIMNQKVVTARPEMSVEEAKGLLVEHHISGMPVLGRGDQVVGMISSTDILESKGETVGEVMTSPAVCVTEDDPIEEVATLLAAKNINRVPVLSEGKLVGIISRADIVRYVATKWAWSEAR